MGQGSHNKPIGCGASGAYVPGLDDEEECKIGSNLSDQSYLQSLISVDDFR
jgi:hypothetical protein